MKKPISAESNFNITQNEPNKSQTINLWNFKLEGSYKNGKGKEYDEYGRLIYEGEYLNGKRHGKGKEYKLDYRYVYVREAEADGIEDIYYLYYEGEYLNGQICGKGKEYNSNRHLIYEGEFLNGKRHGKGKEYQYGKLIFEGEYYNGERH